ncbi:MAG: hypothetical protein NC036_03195 [Muribaculaceae bacterium]|nr:hypothetical protein [Muribaculaceae bacterium]
MKRENSMEKFLVRREELNQRYKSTKYKRLKYTALGFFIADIVLFAIMIATMNNLSDWWYLLLRGCAGVLALIGVIIYVVYVYRINRDYERDKYIRRKDNG